jgi:hypothetical protein
MATFSSVWHRLWAWLEDVFEDPPREDPLGALHDADIDQMIWRDEHGRRIDVGDGGGV